MRKIETQCVQAGYEPKSGDPRVLPIYQSTTYYYETPEEMAHLFDTPKDGHIYSRISNPTVSALETKITELEGGVAAMACSSGMSAEMLAVMTVANAGDNIICMSTVYGGTYNLFNVTLRKYGIDCRFVSPDAAIEDIEKSIDNKTKLIFAETIANPAMVVCDFEKISTICKKHQIVFMVDNTLATPIFVKPFKYGANVVVHSTTKYLDGHAQAVGGIIVDGGNFEYNNNERYKDFWTPDESYHGVVYVQEGGVCAFILKARMQYMRDIGAIMTPFNAYLVNLGTETLHLRMKAHYENTIKIAKALEKHDKIEWVKYPMLANDKYNDLAKKYFDGGCSGMIVIGIKGGRTNAENFIRNLKLIKQVTHIADVRSCVLHPASTTHRQLSDSDLVSCGISPNLVRLSVGIENGDDILNDILDSLAKL